MALSLDAAVTLVTATGTSAVYPALTTSNANDIIVVVAWGLFNHGATVSVADTAGLTWNQRVYGDPAGFLPQALFWAVAPSPLASDVITLTWGASSGGTQGYAFAVSGVNTTTPWDTNGSVPNSAASPDPATISTTAANAMVLGFFRESASSSSTPGTGYTQISSNATNSVSTLAEFQVFSSPQTSLSVTQGSSAGDALCYVCDALVAAAAPGATRVPPRPPPIQIWDH